MADRDQGERLDLSAPDDLEMPSIEEAMIVVLNRSATAMIDASVVLSGKSRIARRVVRHE